MLRWFEEAWSLQKGNADICREASLAALDSGEFSLLFVAMLVMQNLNLSFQALYLGE